MGTARDIQWAFSCQTMAVTLEGQQRPGADLETLIMSWDVQCQRAMATFAPLPAREMQDLLLRTLAAHALLVWKTASGHARASGGGFFPEGRWWLPTLLDAARAARAEYKLLALSAEFRGVLHDPLRRASFLAHVAYQTQSRLIQPVDVPVSTLLDFGVPDVPVKVKGQPASLVPAHSKAPLLLPGTGTAAGPSGTPTPRQRSLHGKACPLAQRIWRVVAHGGVLDEDAANAGPQGERSGALDDGWEAENEGEAGEGVDVITEKSITPRGSRATTPPVRGTTPRGSLTGGATGGAGGAVRRRLNHSLSHGVGGGGGGVTPKVNIEDPSAVPPQSAYPIALAPVTALKYRPKLDGVGGWGLSRVLATMRFVAPAEDAWSDVAGLAWVPRESSEIPTLIDVARMAKVSCVVPTSPAYIISSTDVPRAPPVGEGDHESMLRTMAPKDGGKLGPNVAEISVSRATDAYIRVRGLIRSLVAVLHRLRKLGAGHKTWTKDRNDARGHDATSRPGSAHTRSRSRSRPGSRASSRPGTPARATTRGAV